MRVKRKSKLIFITFYIALITVLIHQIFLAIKNADDIFMRRNTYMIIEYTVQIVCFCYILYITIKYAVMWIRFLKILHLRLRFRLNLQRFMSILAFAPLALFCILFCYLRAERIQVLVNGGDCTVVFEWIQMIVWYTLTWADIW